jgi:hypothetical protein
MRQLAGSPRADAGRLLERLERIAAAPHPQHRNGAGSASAGVSPGNRGAWADRMGFATLEEALDFIREQWGTLRARAPWVADANHWPIYTAEDLVRVIEG